MKSNKFTIETATLDKPELLMWKCNEIQSQKSYVFKWTFIKSVTNKSSSNLTGWSQCVIQPTFTSTQIWQGNVRKFVSCLLNVFTTWTVCLRDGSDYTVVHTAVLSYKLHISLSHLVKSPDDVSLPLLCVSTSKPCRTGLKLLTLVWLSTHWPSGKAFALGVTDLRLNPAFQAGFFLAESY